MEEYKRKGMIDIGKKDTKIKDWLANKKRFADLFNGIVYGGEQVISPYELCIANSESSIMVPGNNSKESVVSKRRDIIMNWKGSCNLAVLAIEAQNDIHYAMPVRNMLYDSLSYVEQMKVLWNNIPENEKPEKFTGEFFSLFRKQDNIYPVITLVIYWGDSGEWDGSKSIYDMFGKNMSDKEKRMLEKYVSNYKINLVEFDKISDINVFKSDLRQAIGMLQCRHDEEKMFKYIEDNSEAVSKMDLETSRAVGEMLNIGSLDKYIKKNAGKKVVDMCKAWDDHRMSGIKEGIRILIKTSKEYGIDDEIIKVKLSENYHLDDTEVNEYMDLYA